MYTCPWGTNELRRLSRHIRDDEPPSPNHPPYVDVMAWYNDVAADVQRRIANLNWPPLLLDRKFEVTSRPKTLDTLRQKLQRDSTIALPAVQDIAGVRFEAEMSLDEQDAVATAICGVFGHDPLVAVRDLRKNPHSGYRAVHIWLRLPVRVEVQVRTHLQGEWANTYEAAADVYGRRIRYDELPDDDLGRTVVVGLREISTIRIARIEEDRNEIATLDLGLEDLRRSGITEIPEQTRLRLDRLRARGQSNEQRMQADLAKLRGFFDRMRDGKG